MHVMPMINGRVIPRKNLNENMRFIIQEQQAYALTKYFFSIVVHVEVKMGMLNRRQSLCFCHMPT